MAVEAIGLGVTGSGSECRPLLTLSPSPLTLINQERRVLTVISRQQRCRVVTLWRTLLESMGKGIWNTTYDPNLSPSPHLDFYPSVYLVDDKILQVRPS